MNIIISRNDETRFAEELDLAQALILFSERGWVLVNGGTYPSVSKVWND